MSVMSVAIPLLTHSRNEDVGIPLVDVPGAVHNAVEGNHEGFDETIDGSRSVGPPHACTSQWLRS